MRFVWKCVLTTNLIIYNIFYKYAIAFAITYNLFVIIRILKNYKLLEK